MTRRLDIYPRWLARFRPVCLLLSLVLASCAKEQVQAPPGEYNVILISLDTLRADHLNCYGYQARKVSPHIDALAADGILFENHIAASPWTTPAHLSMLTSLYPSAHGVTQSFGQLTERLLHEVEFNKLPEARITLAEVLGHHGYVTAAFTGGGTLDPRIGFAQGFQHYDTSMFKLNSLNTETMHNWIGQHRDRRFFLFWHSFEVHSPYLQADFLGEVLPPEAAARLSDQLKDLARPLLWHTPSVAERQSTHLRFADLLRQHQAYSRGVCEALYAGGIRSADRWLGDLLRLLRRLKLYDRCLIIVTSDHGEEFADHDQENFCNKHGQSLYEEMLQVPLIIKLPDQRYAGTRVREQVRMIDLMPTVLDVLGIRPPGGQMQGASLRPLWEQQPGRQQARLAVSESLASDQEMKSIRAGRYKYIFSIDPATVQRHGRGYLPEQAQRTELYDLLDDPGEKVNLLTSPQGDKFKALAEPLEQHLREHVQVQGPAVEQVRLDGETIENLKALGYIP